MNPISISELQSKQYVAFRMQTLHNLIKLEQIMTLAYFMPDNFIVLGSYDTHVSEPGPSRPSCLNQGKIRQGKKRDGHYRASAVPKIQWATNSLCPYSLYRLRETFTYFFYFLIEIFVTESLIAVLILVPSKCSQSQEDVNQKVTHSSVSVKKYEEKKIYIIISYLL